MKKSLLIVAAILVSIAIYFLAIEQTGKDFQLYELQANEIALKIQNGEIIQTPFNLGKYQIKEVGIQSGIVHFWTNLNKNGNSGFVQHPEGKGYNLWHHSQVSPKWSYVIED